MTPELSDLWAALGAWGQLIVWAAAVVGAAGILWRRLKPVVEDVRTLKRIADRTQDTVEEQLLPNGGGSLHDRVAQIHADVRDFHTELREEREERRAEQRRMWDAWMVVARRLDGDQGGGG